MVETEISLQVVKIDINKNADKTTVRNTYGVPSGASIPFSDISYVTLPLVHLHPQPSLLHLKSSPATKIATYDM